MISGTPVTLDADCFTFDEFMSLFDTVLSPERATQVSVG